MIGMIEMWNDGDTIDQNDIPSHIGNILQQNQP